MVILIRDQSVQWHSCRGAVAQTLYLVMLDLFKFLVNECMLKTNQYLMISLIDSTLSSDQWHHNYPDKKYMILDSVTFSTRYVFVLYFKKAMGGKYAKVNLARNSLNAYQK